MKQVAPQGVYALSRRGHLPRRWPCGISNNFRIVTQDVSCHPVTAKCRVTPLRVWRFRSKPHVRVPPLPRQRMEMSVERCGSHTLVSPRRVSGTECAAQNTSSHSSKSNKVSAQTRVLHSVLSEGRAQVTCHTVPCIRCPTLLRQ